MLVDPDLWTIGIPEPEYGWWLYLSPDIAESDRLVVERGITGTRHAAHRFLLSGLEELGSRRRDRGLTQEEAA
jgi:hypothetical protein